MNDYDDLEYVGNATIGSPKGQEFVVVLDTGSADFWIPDRNCITTCKNKHTFDSSKSKTYAADGRTWTVSYGDGSNATGFIGIDSITVCFENFQQYRIRSGIVYRTFFRLEASTKNSWQYPSKRSVRPHL